MKILITLDYELFFGKNVGSLQKSIVEPTNKLLKILDKYNVKVTFFVDSGYILKLQEYKNKFNNLNNDYNQIMLQIKYLHSQGHEIALHIHPHWEDSFYNGKEWILNTKRYKLHDFEQNDIENIVFRYKDILEKIIDNKVIAYRAGGWCIQPFDKIKNTLKNNDIKIDSTLFYKGFNKSKTHYFDFRKMPNKDIYRFENDPLIEDKNGSFTEIPISSIRVSPLFFWKFAFSKIFNKNNKYKSFGDGKAIERRFLDKLKLMTTYSYSVVSIDGYKSTLLESAYKKEIEHNKNYFVIIGHPKALSSFSLENLDKFIRTHFQDDFFITYKDILNEKNI